MFNFSKLWKSNKVQKNNYDSYDNYDLHQDIWIRTMKKLKSQHMLREYDMMYVNKKVAKKPKKKAVYISPTSSQASSSDKLSPKNEYFYSNFTADSKNIEVRKPFNVKVLRAPEVP